jgi:hypothetical protein
MSLAVDSIESSSAVSDDIQIEIVETLEALRAVEPEWRQFLEEGVCGSNFFNDPAYIELYLQHKPQTKLQILVLRQDGVIRCIAPFFQQKSRRKIQLSIVTLATLSLRMLNLFGSDIMVAAKENPQMWLAAVVNALRERCNQFEVILLEHLDVSSPLFNFCISVFAQDRQFRVYPVSPQDDVVYQIIFPATHGEYLAQLNPKTRYRLRCNARKLSDLSHARLESFTTPQDVPKFLRLLDEVYRDTWQSKLYGQRSRTTKEEQRYFANIAERGWLRSYVLTGDQGPLAYVVGFQYDGVFYYYEPGYVQSRPDFGPGNVLLHLLIEDLLAKNSPKVCDFLYGKHAYKRSFGNREHKVASRYLVPPNRWQAILALQGSLFQVERLARSTVVWLKIERPLRSLLKRLGVNVFRPG